MRARIASEMASERPQVPGLQTPGRSSLAMVAFGSRTLGLRRMCRAFSQAGCVGSINLSTAPAIGLQPLAYPLWPASAHPVNRSTTIRNQRHFFDRLRL